MLLSGDGIVTKLVRVAVTVLVKTTVCRDLSHDPAPDVVGDAVGDVVDLEAWPDIVDGVAGMAVPSLELFRSR